MTILVALKDEKNNRVILGTDKQVTYGSTKGITDTKMITINIPVVDGYGETIRVDKCYIATAGWDFIHNFIAYGFNTPSMDNNMLFIEYLQKKFLKKLKNELTDQNLTEENSNQFNSESYFIIVYYDELFNVQFNFGVSKLDEGYLVEGSGYNVALGSLYTSKKMNPNIGAIKRVKLAIESAMEYNIYCGGGVDIRIIDY